MSSPTPDDVSFYTVLRAALLAVLPAGTEVIRAQVNRVPPPKGSSYVYVNDIRRDRLRTNVDSYADVRFTGSIALTVMTVSAVAFGSILAGATVFGTGVAAGTKVVVQLTGPAGGAGTYTVTPSQTLSSRTLASGAKSMEQGTRVDVQIDAYGPLAGDNIQVISTVFRDEAGVALFEEQDATAIVRPLFADDPKQLPFSDDQQQVETRWTVEAMLQFNPVVTMPQQFADSVEVDVVSVEAAFPPS